MDQFQRKLNRMGNKVLATTSMPNDNEGSLGDMKVFGRLLCVKMEGGWQTFTPNLRDNSAEEQVSKTTKGYIMFPNELIIQWGQNTAPANNYSEEFSFPKKFPKAVFAMIGNKSAAHTGASDGNNAGAYIVDLEKYRVYSDDTSQTVHWIAIGH